MTIRDAAKRLGISRQAVHQRILSGTLPARKVEYHIYPHYMWEISEHDLKEAQRETAARKQNAAAAINQSA